MPGFQPVRARYPPLVRPVSPPGAFFSKFPHDHPRRPPRPALTNRPHRTHDAQDGDEGEGPLHIWTGGLGTDWTRVLLRLPDNRSEMSRILVMSVSPGQTLSVDDIEVHP